MEKKYEDDRQRSSALRRDNEEIKKEVYRQARELTMLSPEMQSVTNYYENMVM